MFKTIFILSGLIITLTAQAQVSPIGNLIQQGLDAAQAGPRVMSCWDEVVAYPTREARRCREQPVPAVGQHRLMKKANSYGPKNNYLGYETGDYLLRNVAPNKVQAVMHIDFQAHGDGTVPQANAMLAKTRSCLREMAPFLKGANGEQLDILVLTEDEVERLPANQRPAKRVIKVTDESDQPTYRGNADNFGTNFDCITIGHEILHHLGLCDEYHERSTHDDLATKWACRPVTTSPSYMRDMWYAFNSSVPQTVTCECNEICKSIMAADSKTKDLFLQMESFELIEDNYRQDFCVFREISANAEINTLTQQNRAFILKSEAGNVTTFETRTAQGPTTVWQREVTCTCPAGAAGDYCRRATAELKRRTSAPQQRASCPNAYPKVGDSVLGPSRNSSAVVGDTLRIVTSGNGQSLLRPSHFQKIMAGSCRNPASSYERCAQYSYIPQGPQCADMPAECRNDDFFLNGRPIPAPSTSNQ